MKSDLLVAKVAVNESLLHMRQSTLVLLAKHYCCQTSGGNWSGNYLIVNSAGWGRCSYTWPFRSVALDSSIERTAAQHCKSNLRLRLDLF
jgi:hypothetical protein